MSGPGKTPGQRDILAHTPLFKPTPSGSASSSRHSLPAPSRIDDSPSAPRPSQASGTGHGAASGSGTGEKAKKKRKRKLEGRHSLAGALGREVDEASRIRQPEGSSGGYGRRSSFMGGNAVAGPSRLGQHVITAESDEDVDMGEDVTVPVSAGPRVPLIGSLSHVNAEAGPSRLGPALLQQHASRPFSPIVPPPRSPNHEVSSSLRLLSSLTGSAATGSKGKKRARASEPSAPPQGPRTSGPASHQSRRTTMDPPRPGQTTAASQMTRTPSSASVTSSSTVKVVGGTRYVKKPRITPLLAGTQGSMADMPIAIADSDDEDAEPSAATVTVTARVSAASAEAPGRPQPFASQSPPPTRNPHTPSQPAPADQIRSEIRPLARPRSAVATSALPSEFVRPLHVPQAQATPSTAASSSGTASKNASSLIGLLALRREQTASQAAAVQPAGTQTPSTRSGPTSTVPALPSVELSPSVTSGPPASVYVPTTPSIPLETDQAQASPSSPHPRPLAQRHVIRDATQAAIVATQQLFPAPNSVGSAEVSPAIHATTLAAALFRASAQVQANRIAESKLRAAQAVTRKRYLAVFGSLIDRVYVMQAHLNNKASQDSLELEEAVGTQEILHDEAVERICVEAEQAHQLETGRRRQEVEDEAALREARAAEVESGRRRRREALERDLDDRLAREKAERERIEGEPEAAEARVADERRRAVEAAAAEKRKAKEDARARSARAEAEKEKDRREQEAREATDRQLAAEAAAAKQKQEELVVAAKVKAKAKAEKERLEAERRAAEQRRLDAEAEAALRQKSAAGPTRDRAPWHNQVQQAVLVLHETEYWSIVDATRKSTNVSAAREAWHRAQATVTGISRDRLGNLLMTAHDDVMAKIEYARLSGGATLDDATSGRLWGIALATVGNSRNSIDPATGTPHSEDVLAARSRAELARCETFLPRGYLQMATDAMEQTLLSDAAAQTASLNARRKRATAVEMATLRAILQPPQAAFPQQRQTTADPPSKSPGPSARNHPSRSQSRDVASPGTSTGSTALSEVRKGKKRQLDEVDGGAERSQQQVRLEVEITMEAGRFDIENNSSGDVLARRHGLRPAGTNNAVPTASNVVRMFQPQSALEQDPVLARPATASLNTATASAPSVRKAVNGKSHPTPGAGPSRISTTGTSIPTSTPSQQIGVQSAPGPVLPAAATNATERSTSADQMLTAAGASNISAAIGQTLITAISDSPAMPSTPGRIPTSDANADKTPAPVHAQLASVPAEATGSPSVIQRLKARHLRKEPGTPSQRETETAQALARVTETVQALYGPASPVVALSPSARASAASQLPRTQPLPPSRLGLEADRGAGAGALNATAASGSSSSSASRVAPPRGPSGSIPAPGDAPDPNASALRARRRASGPLLPAPPGAPPTPTTSSVLNPSSPPPGDAPADVDVQDTEADMIVAVETHFGENDTLRPGAAAPIPSSSRSQAPTLPPSAYINAGNNNPSAPQSAATRRSARDRPTVNYSIQTPSEFYELAARRGAQQAGHLRAQNPPTPSATEDASTSFGSPPPSSPPRRPIGRLVLRAQYNGDPVDSLNPANEAGQSRLSLAERGAVSPKGDVRAETLKAYGMFCPSMLGRRDNKWTSWSTKIVPGTLHDLMWELDILFAGDNRERPLLRRLDEEVVWGDMRDISDKRRFVFCCWNRYTVEKGTLRKDQAAQFIRGWLDKYGEVMRFGGIDEEILDHLHILAVHGLIQPQTYFNAAQNWNRQMRYYRKMKECPLPCDDDFSDAEEFVTRGSIRLREFEEGGRCYEEVLERGRARAEGRPPVLPEEKYYLGTEKEKDGTS